MLGVAEVLPLALCSLISSFLLLTFRFMRCDFINTYLVYKAMQI